MEEWMVEFECTNGSRAIFDIRRVAGIELHVGEENYSGMAPAFNYRLSATLDGNSVYVTDFDDLEEANMRFEHLITKWKKWRT